MTETTTAPTNGDQAAAGDDQGLCLVVADRGHVWVGHVSSAPDWTTVKDARVVRRWGTTQGLNELATKGPRPNTQLDLAATVKVATKAIIALIPCEAGAWIA